MEHNRRTNFTSSRLALKCMIRAVGDQAEQSHVADATRHQKHGDTLPLWQRKVQRTHVRAEQRELD